MEDRFKQIKDILKTCTTLPCAECGCNCNNCDDETAVEDGKNTCMQYGINKILELLEQPQTKEKIVEEYKKLCNRILNKSCMGLDHARGMIKIFNFYTQRGTQLWDWKKIPTKGQRKRIYGEN